MVAAVADSKVDPAAAAFQGAAVDEEAVDLAVVDEGAEDPAVVVVAVDRF